jgi:mutual gliding-motility protein MglA
MVFFNWATMQMAAKIVYYGPGLCGKTTNLSYIYARTAPGSRGEMVSLETETERTLFFDLLPLEVGKLGSFRTRLQLYTVPGQVFYNTTRKLVLKGVDGIVFVADSQRPLADANLESLQNLDENLRGLGLSLTAVPTVLQYNKRDLKNILTLDELNAKLNPAGTFPFFEAVAVSGQGVFDTLKGITKLTLRSLRKRMASLETLNIPPPAPVAARTPVVFSPAALNAAAVEGLTATSEAALAAPAVPVGAVGSATPARRTTLDLVSSAASPAAAPKAEPLPTSEPITEETPVEFATSGETVPAAKPSEIRHVRVSSPAEILAELESLRKTTTSRPAMKPVERPDPNQIEELVRESLDSRHETKRSIDEWVGAALGQASRCRVSIELVDAEGTQVKVLTPLEVDLKKKKLRQLNLTLLLNLRGD